MISKPMGATRCWWPDDGSEGVDADPQPEVRVRHTLAEACAAQKVAEVAVVEAVARAEQVAFRALLLFSRVRVVSVP
jgi:hypothetical protein